MEEVVKAIRSAHPGVTIRRAYCRTNSKIVHIQVEDLEQGLSGAGSADSTALALKKAYSEFIERTSMRFVFGDNLKMRISSGFACHTHRDYSASNSLAEIIERVALLCTWLTHIPAYWLSTKEISELKLPEWYPQSENLLLQRGLDHMDFYLKPANFPRWFFESNSNVTALVSPPIAIEDVQPVPNPFDLKVTRASSRNIQQFFVGSGRGKVNLHRIEVNFTGYRALNLNTMPHPIV